MTPKTFQLWVFYSPAVIFKTFVFWSNTLYSNPNNILNIHSNMHEIRYAIDPYTLHTHIHVYTFDAIPNSFLRFGLHDRSYFNIILNHSPSPNHVELFSKECMHCQATRWCVSLRFHNQLVLQCWNGGLWPISFELAEKCYKISNLMRSPWIWESFRQRKKRNGKPAIQPAVRYRYCWWDDEAVTTDATTIFGNVSTVVTIAMSVLPSPNVKWWKHCSVLTITIIANLHMHSIQKHTNKRNQMICNVCIDMGLCLRQTVRQLNLNGRRKVFWLLK